MNDDMNQNLSNDFQNNNLYQNNIQQPENDLLNINNPQSQILNNYNQNLNNQQSDNNYDPAIANMIQMDKSQFVNNNQNNTQLTFDNQSKYADTLEELNKKNEQKIASIKITGEVKTFLLIIAIMLIFIIFLPYLFDIINNL